jgi:hypothetical protein
MSTTKPGTQLTNPNQVANKMKQVARLTRLTRQQAEAIEKAVEKFSQKEWALLEPRSREWKEAWKGLAYLSGDDDFEAENKLNGEVWQYMGSVRHAGAWGHEFRHREHPLTGRRWVLTVRASPAWGPVQKNGKRAPAQTG